MVSNFTGSILLSLSLVTWVGWVTIDQLGRGVAGFETGAGARVVAVDPEGAAAQTELMVGDRLLSVQGHDTPDSSAVQQWTGGRVGETRSMRIARGSDVLELTLQLAPVASTQRFQLISRVLLALLCILSPFIAQWRRPTRAGRALMVCGWGIGLAVAGLPGLAGKGVEMFLVVLRNGFVLAGIAASVHFLLLYPRPRAFLAATGIAWLYLPAGILWALLSWQLLSGAPEQGALVGINRIAAAVLMLAYGLTALILLSRSAVREWLAGSKEGSVRLLALLLAGVLPYAMGRVMGSIWPQWTSSELGLLLLFAAVVPVAWSVQVAKAAKPEPEMKAHNMKH